MTTKTRVGDVVSLQRRFIEVEPTHSYRQIGIRSFGNGIFHYESRPGSELGKMRYLEIRPGDLVISNIKAWEGAVAMASDRELGCIGTNRMLTYVATGPSAVELRYLFFYLRSEKGLALLGRASPGSADRNRTLGIDRFESLHVELPPVEEQRIVADRIASLLQRIDTAQEKIHSVSERIQALTPSVLNQAFGRR